MSDVATRGPGGPVDYRAAHDWPALQALIALSVRPEPGTVDPTDLYLAPWRLLRWLDQHVDDFDAATLMAADLYTPIPESRPWLHRACDTLHDLLAGVDARCARVTHDQARFWAEQVLDGNGVWSTAAEHDRQTRAARRFLGLYHS